MAHLIAFTYLRFVAALFGLGMSGCLVVLVMTFFEDAKTVFGIE